MHPTKFEQAYEKPLGAGDNPNTGDLPFRVARDPRTPGVVMLVSCWELSPRELEEVIKTGKVFVAVMAHEEYRTQPPISVHGCNPFEYLPGAAYIPVPRTLHEEHVDKVIDAVNRDRMDPKPVDMKELSELHEATKEKELDRSGLLEASGLGEQIFPESNGIAPALEVREDPRARTFTEEVTGKKLAN